MLELAAGFVFLISVTTTPTLIQTFTQGEFGYKYSSLISQAVYDTLNAELLPIGIFCGVLVSLSFARDYEQGLMQMLISSPLSRSAIFIIKFLAVTVPLTFLSWSLILTVITLNFYSDLNSLLTIINFCAWAFPAIFLIVIFSGGLAVLISLSIRKAIPAALFSLTIGFILHFLTTLKAEAIGPLADYLSITPFKAPLTSLSKLFGIPAVEGTIESSLPAWGFLSIAIAYSLVFLVPTYLYFTRRFEVRE